MTPSVVERLRAALAPEILVERELGRGGMGIVVAGRDTVLDRPIAIKTLRPEFATAVAVERFVREGRAAAKVSHPNVIPVYRAGLTKDGDPYFTMALVEGRTLAARLEHGHLSAAETLAVGRDILDALATAHARKLIHRDIKPSNIFLQGERALLGDFGIASTIDSTASILTEPGQPVGTPQYMAPEQLAADRVTPATDLYALGLVLFESCTGRAWERLGDPETADWTGVPPQLRAPLAKALQVTASNRWQSARSFRAALDAASDSQGALRWRPPAPMRILLMLLVAALAAGAGVLIWTTWLSPRPPVDIAVFPFDLGGLGDTSLSGKITYLTRLYFERLPALKVQAPKLSAHDWDGSRLPPATRLTALTSRRGARFGVWGVIGRRQTGLDIEVSAVNGRGEPVFHDVVQGDSAHLLALVDRLGARVLGALAPELGPVYRRTRETEQFAPDAVLEFVQGEAAASRDAWLSAERHYSRAVSLDSTFVLAGWRLGNARRWMPLRPTPPFPAGFRRQFEAHRQAFSLTDQRLVDAQFAASGEPRFQKYEEALRGDPNDPTTMLLFGDELFHRGPLVGRPLEDAVGMLAQATAADPTLGPAWEHLAWALIRLGRRAEAARALDSLRGVAGRPEESEIYLPAFLGVAYELRFAPDSLSPQGSALLGAPGALALAARGALAFDLPEVELAFGRRLASLDNAPPALRGSGHVAQGVALMALGRPAAALAQFDSAAGLLQDSAEGRLQAAEWRVLPTALGVPGMPEAATAEGRRALAQMADGGESARAVWALGVDALARGDTIEARRWQSRLAAAGQSDTLGLLLTAMAAATRGAAVTALQVSARALAFDSAGYAPDPFYRSAVHLLRGQWLASAGRTIGADRSWLWYENTDVVGWPSAGAQAPEVDWALATYARVRRAQLAVEEGRRPVACPLARRALQIWSKPEPTLGPAADRLRRLVAGCAT